MPSKTVTRSGETWDEISFRVYGDEHGMHRLIAENIGHGHVVRFPQGVELSVPDIPKTVNANLPPWKRS